VFLTAAAIPDSKPRFAHSTTLSRFNGLPLFHPPQSAMSKLCLGFGEVFKTSRLFDNLLLLVNQARCLAIALSLATSRGRPNIPYRTFQERGYLVKFRLLDLPNEFTLETNETVHFVFECYRCATIIFNELVLHGVQSDLSLPTTLEPLIPKLLAASETLDIEKSFKECAESLFWVFAIGGMTSSDEDTRIPFLSLLDQAVRFLHLETSMWQEAKELLVMYLWVEELLDGLFMRLWATLQKTLCLDDVRGVCATSATSLLILGALNET
jgi:hypothetical protein